MTADLTMAQLLQLYAPLAGLLVVTFMLGALSNRVKTLEREREQVRADTATELHEGREDHDTLVRMEADMRGVKDTLEKMDRNWQGVQRQLATLSSGKYSKPMNTD